MPLLSRGRLRLFESLVDAAARRRTKRAAHLETGERGERAAFFHLRRMGYTIVARGWRSGRAPGDLDLIAWEGDTVCFVEVKTRTTRDVAAAEYAVDEHKRRTLRRLARHYLRQLPDSKAPTRFDILSIYFEAEKAAEFELFRGAFGWNEAEREATARFS
jgi:putative endonuclease